MENTAIRLSRIMSERKLKQVDVLRLAEPYCKKYHTKLNKSDLSQFINGKVKPGQWKLTILGLALNVSEAWLMGYDVPMDRGGFGALDPVLPPNMQGVNLDGAKIDATFLNYMLSGLSRLPKDSPNYLNARNNILAIAESSGLRPTAIKFINELERNAREHERPTTVSDDGLSKAKKLMIEKIMQMDDDTVAGLDRIADSILAVRDKQTP